MASFVQRRFCRHVEVSEGQPPVSFMQAGPAAHHKVTFTRFVVRHGPLAHSRSEFWLRGRVVIPAAKLDLGSRGKKSSPPKAFLKWTVQVPSASFGREIQCPSRLFGNKTTVKLMSALVQLVANSVEGQFWRLGNPPVADGASALNTYRVSSTVGVPLSCLPLRVSLMCWL